jgi:hypothetical protein
MLDKLADAVRLEAEPQVGLAREAVNHWQSGISPDQSDGYIQNLKSLLENVNLTSPKILQVTQEFPQYCENDLCLIVDPRKTYSAIYTALDRFRFLIERMHYLIDAEKFKRLRSVTFADEIMEPHVKALDHSVSDFQNWVVKAKGDLSARRAELSKIASRQ